MSELGPWGHDPGSSRKVRKMLRTMERREARAARGARLRGLRPRTIAAVGIFVLLLSGFMARIVIDPESTGVVVAWPDSPDDAVSAAPPREVPGGGTYAFLATQPDSDEPVTYDPCRPIHLVVNERTAPPDADAILADAIREIEERTGLRMVVDGVTDQAPQEEWLPQQEGDDWAPILLAWSDPDEYADLEGAVAGLAGSGWLPRDGHRWYVSGQVVLDGPQLRRGGTEQATITLLHEFGHLLGLDHVDDPDELMYPVSQGQTGWGPGDLAGLNAVGQGRCA